jgi:hypothetical protein
MAESQTGDNSLANKQHKGKILPTIQSNKYTKKHFIKEYAKNRPLNAIEIANLANKIVTTPNYVHKVLSIARTEGKMLRGRKGRIFVHGKSYFGWSVMPDTASMLLAPVLNSRTGMKQIGYKGVNPCSCQIHSNGRIIIWPHSTGWKEWLISEFIRYGWTAEMARFVVEQALIQFSSIEGGAKPIDPTFLPETLFIEAEWGVALVKDNTPEKSVLEVRFNIPRMHHFLGLPEIRKRLAVIEQGSVTLNQAYKSVVALLLQQNRQWEALAEFLIGKKGDDEKR